MTSHAGMTSHNLEEEEATHVPRSWSGRIYFSFAAIRKALQSNPTHKKLPAPTVQAHKCGAAPLSDDERLHQSKQPCFRLNRTCHSRPKDVHNCTLTGKDDSQAHAVGSLTVYPTSNDSLARPNPAGHERNSANMRVRLRVVRLPDAL